MCYEIGAPACTACGGDTFVPLANFLEQAPRRVQSNKTAKQLIVVARDQQRLYEYARRAFAGNPTVEIVLDRRRAERRREDELRTPERRRGDRRVTLEVDDRLRTTGWAIVRLDVFRSFGAASRS